jgi:hypothetical protein
MMDIEKCIEKLGSIVDETVKGIQSLMIANGVALVTCLTLLKDYDSTTKYKGLGTFIALFGSGFLAALTAFVISFHLRLGFYDLMFQRPLKERGNWSLWLTGGFTLASVVMLAVAVSIIVSQFKSL